MKDKNNGFFILPTSFLDILFNLSLVFLALLIMILIIMKVEIVKTKIDAQAEFIITMTWPEGDWDMDIWIEDPDGKVMFYQNKTTKVLNLERDDTGLLSDTFVINGEEAINPLNQEIVVVRGIYPGKYIINVHLYRTGGGEETGYSKVTADGEPDPSGRPKSPETLPVPLVKPIDVFVKVDKINPILTTVYAGKTYIEYNRQEHYVVTFSIDAEGNVYDIITDNPVSLQDKTGLGVVIQNANGYFEEHNVPYPVDGVP